MFIIATLFEGLNNVICLQTIGNFDNENDIHAFITNNVDIGATYKIILLTDVYSPSLLMTFTVNENEYELRYISTIFNERNGTFDSFVFARHGGDFSDWWFQQRENKIMIEYSRYPVLETNHKYTLAYIRSDAIDESSVKLEFLELLGGQSHVRCHRHKMPLIVSPNKEKCSRCSKRREFYCCTVHDCDIRLCKKCFNDCDPETNHFIEAINTVDESDEDDTTTDDDDEDDDNDICSIEDSIGLNHNINEDVDSLFLFQNSNINNTNDNEDFLGITEPLDIEFDDVSMSSSVNSFTPGVLTTNDTDDNAQSDLFLPSTNAADYLLDVHGETVYGGPNNEIHISGSGLLCETTSILTRKLHDMHGSRVEKNFVQRFCASTNGTLFPLMYPESAMFPSIFWSGAKDDFSIAGAIPSPLLSGSIKEFGFAEIAQHIRSRLTCPSTSTSSDPNYVIFCHDSCCSIASNHCDTRKFGNGMTAADDSVGGLDLRSKEDSNFLHSIDSRQMVKNLCSSQEYFPWDFFLTFTCNMRKHFGTKPIREWLDNDEWKQHYPRWESYTFSQQIEIKKSLHQAASGLFLRVWEEVSAIFIDFLGNGEESPFAEMLAAFARKEYQPEAGNLSHIHFLGKLKEMSERARALLMDLIRSNVVDIIRSDEVDRLIEDGYIKNEDDSKEIQHDGLSFLRHRCNHRCLVPDKNGILRCRATSYGKSKENTKHSFIDLPNNYSKPCLERLGKADLAVLTRNESNEICSFNSNIDYFHPKKHIPPWKRGDPNISPCETKTFIACRSMQNIQMLCGSGGSCKYCCKYVAKVDKCNYMTVSTASDGRFVRRSNFLHNTKIVTSDKTNRRNVNQNGVGSILKEELSV